MQANNIVKGNLVLRTEIYKEKAEADFRQILANCRIKLIPNPQVQFHLNPQ
jgi:hypothetical protein